MGYENDEIKRRVKLRDVLKRYGGMEPDRKGFCRCPFHGEKTASMKIYDSNDSFYCFGCGQGGNAVNLCAAFCGISYLDALKRIDADFGLNVFRPTSAMERTRQAAKRELEQRRKEQQAAWCKEQYYKLNDFAKELEKMPLSAAVSHDIAYIDRLLDKFRKSENEPFDGVPDDFDADARIAALRTKYREGDADGSS
jgi:DNA primase (bacterial type)